MTGKTQSPRATSEWRERLGRQKQGTPSHLRLAAAVLVILSVVTGLVATLAASGREIATSAARQRSEPLVIEAQTIDTALSDANTTAAASFLHGRLEPTAVHDRYARDLAQASASLAVAAQGAGSDTAVTKPMRALSTDLPAYTGLVETAAFNEREAFYPLAAAYLAEANYLMQGQILPAASQLYQLEANRLADDQHHAVRLWLVLLAGLLFASLIVLLVTAQGWLSSRFRRTINAALAVATLLLLVVGIWFTIASVAQDSGVHSALADGSRPVATFTKAEIFALELRADDELTLLTRDSVSSYQKDWLAVHLQLERLLSQSAVRAGPVEQARLHSAGTALDRYVAVHQQIRKADLSGDLAGAVGIASGSTSSELPAVSTHLESVLADSTVRSQQTFDLSASGAIGDLGPVRWAAGIAGLLVAVLVLIGLRARLAEYR